MSDREIVQYLAESKHMASEELPEAVRDVLRWALARTPYLGSADRSIVEPRTVGDLARTFDYLMPELADAAVEARMTSEAHAALQADVAAFRRVIGGVLGTVAP